MDVVVENKLVVELKSVERIMGSHEAQRLTYMKIAEIETGLLINFNITRLAKGIKRFVF
jgi:GxxExxY protein